MVVLQEVELVVVEVVPRIIWRLIHQMNETIIHLLLLILVEVEVIKRMFSEICRDESTITTMVMHQVLSMEDEETLIKVRMEKVHKMQGLCCIVLEENTIILKTSYIVCTWI